MLFQVISCLTRSVLVKSVYVRLCPAMSVEVSLIPVRPCYGMLFQFRQG